MSDGSGVSISGAHRGPKGRIAPAGNNAPAGGNDLLHGFGGPASAQAIAAHISRLVARGELAPGQRLPTVRRAAVAFSVSATTIGEVWQTLGRSGVIETAGRRGTFVRATVADRTPRFWHLYPPEIGEQGIDLSEGVPDPRLLPDLAPFLASLSSPTTSSYLDSPILPELDRVLRERWPFEPEALTVVDGALDALDRLIAELVSPGMRVLVEEPGFPPLYDILEIAGAEVVGLPIDAEGVLPEALEAALKQFASVIVLQPGEHNPTGFRLTTERALNLAQILSRSGTIIIEDDHRPFNGGASLGHHLPGQTVHIRSFSKTHGPEIRLAAVGGAGVPVRSLVRRRQLGPGWSSRLLQQLLVDMIQSESVQTQVADAQRAYAERRLAVTRILDDRGVTYAKGEGMNLWIEVADERSALVALASQGIVVAPGGPFVLSNQTNHIRVTVGTVDKDHTELAQSLADAALRRGRADI